MRSAQACGLRVLLRATVTAAALLLALAADGCGGAHARYEHHLARGRQYLAEGNLDKAAIEFRNAVQLQPKDADALYLSGRVAEQRGSIQEAVGFYRAAIEVRPDDAAARASLGRVFVFGGGAAQALEVIGPALAKHPDDADLLVVRGAARHQIKDDSAARADAERAVQLAPTNEDAIALLAALHSAAGEDPRALALLSDAVHKLPSSVGLHEVLAQLYVAAGESQQAEAELRKLAELRPRELPRRLRLALFYRETGRLDDAERTLREALQALPASDQAKLALVDFLATWRTPTAGEKALREFIAKDPDNYELRLGLGTLLHRTGAPQRALEAYAEVARRAADGPRGLIARDRMAAIHVAAGRYDEALKIIAEVLRANPHDDDALTLRGGIALERQDATGAINDLRAVLRDQPNATGVQSALARAYVLQGNAVLAEETLRAARQAAPHDSAVAIGLAQLLGQTQRGDQAVALLEQTVRESPADTSARQALVRAYLAQRDFKAARTAVADLETLQPKKAIGPYLAGLVAQADNHPEESLREFERALALEPTAVDALAALSKLELARGRGAAAVTRVRAAVQTEPQNAILHNLLGELLITTQTYPEAIAELSAAIQVAPKWPVPYHNLAGAAASAGDLARATSACEAGLKAAPFEPTLVVDLAALYERQGRIADAIAQYERLYEHNPGLDVAANNLAVLLVTYKTDPKSLDRARDLSAKFASSDNGLLLDTNGWVRFKRGDVSGALPVLERAAARAPLSSVIRYHLALAQLQAGQKDRARANLESALAGAARFSGAEDARTVLASLKGRTG